MAKAYSLVTGGAGFIGSNLARSLKDARVLDNFFGSNLKVEGLFKDLGIELIKADINDTRAVEKALEGVDTVYHLAALSSVQQSIENPIENNRINIEGTLALLTACVGSGVRNFIFASSSAVYGDNPENPKREDMRPSPESPYAVSKLAGEHYCGVFSELYGIRATALRYFNVYGPGQNPKSQYAAVIPLFVERALLGKPLTIYGGGTQTRDFVYVDDVVEANKKAAGKSGVYNIGSGEAITIKALAEKIIAATGSKSEIRYGKARKGDVLHSSADISKAKKELGWGPSYSLSKGIEQYVSRRKDATR